MDKEYKILFAGEQQAELAEGLMEEILLEPDEIIGKTLYTLISTGTEMNLYLGNYQREGIPWGRFPIMPGYAAVFEVEQVGCEVTDLHPGAKVFCMGPHRSWQRFPRKEVIPLPAGMDEKKAPFARLMNVTMSTLTTTPVRPPAKVLITGLGPIGILAALLFKRCGYEIIACDPLEQRCRVARGAGIEKVFSELPLNDTEIKGKVSLVLECSGHEKAVMDGLSVIRKGGEVVLIGVPMVRKTGLFAQELMNSVFRSCASLRTGTEWVIPRHPTDYRMNSIFENQAAALRWIAEGSIPLEDMYELESPKNARQIYQDLQNHKRNSISILLDWTKL